MAVFNILDPLFAGIDALFSWIRLPVPLRLILWGGITSYICLRLFYLFAPEKRLSKISRRLKSVRAELLSYDGDFTGLNQKNLEMLRLSFQQLGLAFFPTLLATIPLIMMILWLGGELSYEVPQANVSLTAWVTYDDHAAVTDDAGTSHTATAVLTAVQLMTINVDPPLSFRFSKPVNLIHRKAWFNLLMANPNGYLAADQGVQKVVLDLKRREVAALGMDWMRGWEFYYFSFLILCSLLLHFSKSRRLQKSPLETGIQVPRDQLVLGGFVCRHRKFFVKLGNLETLLVKPTLEDISIQQPIYIAGLARSGTTILLEIIARHSRVATHRYKDFPFIFIPYWWNSLMRILPRSVQTPTERTHQDRILITAESPEAMEEVLWMTFFPQAHDVQASSVLDRSVSHPDFEKFYREHIRKLLLIRKCQRYAAKGNYNLSRLEYLLRVFPDARFLIPVRHPNNHIASLMKQHRLFCREEMANKDILNHMRRVGHFEFGLDLRPIHIGDADAIREIMSLWQSEATAVQGWSRYWSMLHQWVLDRLENDPGLRACSMIVRYEDLCSRPSETLQAIFAHLDLSCEQAILDEYVHKLSLPDYYQSGFSEDDLRVIDEETRDVARQLGYT